MDTYRAILAIVLAFLVLLGYQYLFVAPQEKQQQTLVEETAEPQQPEAPVPGLEPGPAPAAVEPAGQPAQFEQPASLPSQEGREIVVETNKYRTVISETGGGIKSFLLKNYRETNESDAQLKELISTDSFINLPLYFTWGVDPKKAQIPLFAADQEELTVTAGENQTLTMTAQLSSGLQVTRRMTFKPDSYLIDIAVDIYNFSETPLQGSPYMSLTNRPFEGTATRYLFS
ncbi:MAG: membrane protein insertase YidC, partial [Deltaproteobacteria bacterium]|nr:membrane protein insertase YidC [Deltaproteobacteria bacterium]